MLSLMKSHSPNSKPLFCVLSGVGNVVLLYSWTSQSTLTIIWFRNCRIMLPDVHGNFPKRSRMITSALQNLSGYLLHVFKFCHSCMAFLDCSSKFYAPPRACLCRPFLVLEVVLCTVVGWCLGQNKGVVYQDPEYPNIYATDSWSWLCFSSGWVWWFSTGSFPFQFWRWWRWGRRWRRQ